ncbi:MAG: gliding motility-associated C-terminal domain-containing protein [Elusimicrobiota bacterium]|nr:gliding motility-associated C-terminal domain-containing protein [Elusimicrobiota bacterium]
MRALRQADFVRVVTAALRAAAAACVLSLPALGVNPSRLNVGVAVQGIAGVSDLTATPGTLNGTIDLVWTEPRRNGTTGPHAYDVRVSTVAQIPDHAAFLAAQPLTALSSSPIPSPGPGGGQAGMVVTGLATGVVHYFAIRELDSLGAFGAWVRAGARNLANFTAATSVAPDPVTNLSALPGPSGGQVTLSWTAPGPPVLTEHRVYFATFSVASVGGSTTAWFAAAASSVSVVPAVAPVGATETAVLSLADGERYWFGVKSANNSGLGALDLLSAGAQAEARAKGIAGVTDLAASPGAGTGIVSLTWTTPAVSSVTAPVLYQVAVSTVGFLNTTTDFIAAPGVAVFSTSPVPAYGSAGAAQTYAVENLTPGVTHYFAVRAVDASTPTLAGAWTRLPAAGRNASSSSLPSYTPVPPLPVTDLSALPGSAEGQVALTWTSPQTPSLVPVASYEVRYASTPLSAFAGSTTAWFAAAASSVTTPGQAAGTTVSRLFTGLAPASTWYFAVKTVDAAGQTSLIDARMAAADPARTLPFNVAPSSPTGLSAVPGLLRVSLSWTDLSAAGKGLDFAHYRLQRSTDQSNYVQVTTLTAVSYLDIPLAGGVTVYYRLTARDAGGFESVAATASARPANLVPMEPLGIGVVSNPLTTTLSWSPVTRFYDGTAFLGPVPTADELSGYRIYRSTTPCAENFVSLTTVPAAQTSYVDNSLGSSYQYRVASYNTEGLSLNAQSVSTLGDRSFQLDTCDNIVTMDKTAGAALDGDTNGLGHDIRILGERRPQDVGGTVFQSVSWKAYLDGVTELTTFVLPKPARVTLRYDVDGSGAPVPSTSPFFGAQGVVAPAGGASAAAAGAGDLGVYWHNGAEFKKMYGQVDPVSRTVSVESPNLGVYQIRALQRAAGAVFDLSNLSGRVVTPNGDGLNDTIIFTYDPGPNNAAVSGRIYDLNGGFVADMRPGLVPNTLVWDGKMNGRAATSGVYVYRVSGDGKTFTGTVVVAR